MADNDIEIRIRVSGDGAAAFRRVRSESRALEGDLGRVTDTLGIMPMSLGKFAMVGVPAIAVVGQAAAAAVPLILSLAAAGATVAAGMDGIKAAAAQLQAPMDALKKSVSDTFQRELTPVFAKLIGVFPTLTDGMNMMAVSISQVAGQLVDVITSEAGIASLGETFRGASNFVLGMGDGLASLTQTLLTMGSAAAPVMAQLGADIGSIFINLNKEINALVTSGAFQAAIAGFGSTVRGLGEVFAAVFGAMVRVGAAVGPAIGQALGVIADVIVMLTPILTLFGQLFATVMAALVAEIGPVIAALTPFVEMIAGALMDCLIQITPLVMELAVMIGDFLGAAIQELAPLMPPLVQAFKDLMPPIMELGQKLLVALPPILEDIIAVIRVLVPLLAEWIPVIARVLVAIIEFVTNAGAKFQELQLTVQTRMVRIQQIFHDTWTEIANYFTAKGNQIALTAKSIAVRIQQAFSMDWGAVGRAVIDGIANGINGGVGRLAAAARNAAMSAFNAAKAALGIASPSQLFRDGVGKQITAGIVVGIKETAGDVARATADAAAGGLRGQFRNALAAARAAGKTIFEDYTWKGMSEKFADDSLRFSAMTGGTSGVGGAYAGLGDMVKYGSVDDATWKKLLKEGWKGRAGDGMEALYRPGGGGGGGGGMGGGMGGGGGGGVVVSFAGDLDSAFATAFMKLYRTGKIQISAGR